MLFARAGQFLSTVARHAVPIGGFFGRDWHPVTAIAVYWLESVLMVLTAAALCVLIKRRTSDAVVEEARREGDEEGVRALQMQRGELTAASIEPQAVIAFNLGSLGVFGLFFAAVALILVGNGHVEPMRWRELREGAQVMAVVIALGFMFDLWRFDRLTVAAVKARVDACMVRWGLFWLLGFAGTGLMALSGRPAIFFGFFAALKVTFESWAYLARLLGWRSLNDRAADTAAFDAAPSAVTAPHKPKRAGGRRKG